MELFYLYIDVHSLTREQYEEVRNIVKGGMMTLYSDDTKWAFFDEESFELAKYELTLRNLNYEY